jgi:DNA polymerase III subunit epsilon
MTDYEAIARTLEAHEDYRVLRRLQPVERFVPDDPAHELKHAVVVDVETTGIDKASDVIIELGIVRFSYDAVTGQPVEVLAAASFLEDPGRPLSEEIIALTGITDEMVRGQRIPDEEVATLLQGAGIVLAHNASFDRPFVERRLPAFRDVHWGCTQRDIDWRALGAGSHALEFLVYRHLHGFFDGHRAVDDCRATLALLATRTADGVLPMAKLLESCRTPRVRVCAVGSAFETKDALRQRGYKWSGNDGVPAKTWCRELPESALEAEQQWLREAVYTNGRGAATVDKVDLRRRWS